MAIKRERPSQRLFHRVDAPLMVEIGGERLRASDWSLGGCRVYLETHDYAVGSTELLTVHVPFQGFHISFETKSTVIRAADGAGDVAFRFGELDDRQTSLLEHFIEDLLRGSMTAAEDTIRRIDTPVTPISTKPDPNPLAQTPLHRVALSRLLKFAAYAGLGVIVFGYAAFAIYMNVMKVEVRSAVVSAPIETILASTSGVITEMRTQVGSLVDPGTIMMVIEDANLEEAIERARIKISRARLDVESERDALSRARVRLGMQRDLAERDVRLAGIAVEEQRAVAAASAAAANRLAKLQQKGYATRSKLDQARAKSAGDKAALQRAREQLRSTKEFLRSTAEGSFYDGRYFRDEVAEAQNRIQNAEAQIALAEQELAALRAQRARISVRAPSRGRLVRQFKSVGSGVKRGEPIALFELDAARSVEAFLTQEEAASVRVGREVTIWLPGLDQEAQAVVVGIDRTDSFIDPVNGRYTWRDPEARTARAILQLKGSVSEDLAALVPPGTPVVVLFERNSIVSRAFESSLTAHAAPVHEEAGQ